MKKYLSTLAIFALSQDIKANNTFYLGANLSLGAMSGKRNDLVTNNPPGAAPTTAILANDKGVNKKGVYGGIFTGYLFRFNNFGIGPEFFWNYGKIEDNISGQHFGNAVTTQFDIKHRITTQTGINARIGYFLETYFLYALAGLHWQKGNFQTKAINNDGGMYEYPYRTSNKITLGYNVGLGLQKQLTESYDVGVEYKFTHVPKKNYEFNIGDDNKTKLISNVKYNLHTFGLRFIYKFTL